MSARSKLGPKPRLGYSNNHLDRAAERRIDKSAMTAFAATSDCRAYVICDEMIVLKQSSPLNEAVFTMDECRAFGPATEMVFLGLACGAPRFGYGLRPQSLETLKRRDDLLVTDLRSVAVHGLTAPEDLAPIAEAKALLHWHARHGYCANCGAVTNSTEAGWRRDCPSCKAQHFPRTDPVVIMLAVDGERCLLGRSPRFAPTMWSCLAGFMEAGEAIEDAVRRETCEEAGIVCGRVKYYASQPWPFPSSLMIGCHAEALSTEIIVDQNELEAARWFSKDEIVSMLMREHPAGLTTPPPVAIAYHIIRAWVENEIAFG